MKESARYTKIVEWSDTDQCFIGSCPDLFYGGCHGDDEKAVFAELCEIGYPLKAGHQMPQWFQASKVVASSDGHSGRF